MDKLTTTHHNIREHYDIFLSRSGCSLHFNFVNNEEEKMTGLRVIIFDDIRRCAAQQAPGATAN